MMRGINHQNIFEDTEDYYQFVNTLDRMRVRYDDEGNPCGSNCTYYAYCLMNNHFHLLIREREETVGETVKRIASSMAADKRIHESTDTHKVRNYRYTDSLIYGQINPYGI